MILRILKRLKQINISNQITNNSSFFEDILLKTFNLNLFEELYNFGIHQVFSRMSRNQRVAEFNPLLNLMQKDLQNFVTLYIS